ncbi:DUF4118 domain-containing protein [uncultured Oxalicibacterium sp.]|uniref:DUF4118 domain-containing protein n=1 Tax=uncultured Oxalicibacterium sp. TaxID=1168540 RepID=UPI0025CF8D83|nr:DUF4118 domain-containing protein [uncultured Oxalicibacterium sp.]
MYDDYQPRRPDPDSLLTHMQEHARRAARGKLRIYFGAAAGVGKTFAMLSAAHALQREGRAVLVGIVETHGRRETADLLAGMEILPRKTVQYRDKALEEFDIDAALQRHPDLVLVDELAHSNAPGSRHPKRWQDVEELLEAGIDVFTTVNVQHLESLNDVVGGITGILVTETFPDTLFDAAHEVVLVDIPADELLARLKSGKVYREQQAERAARNFFRKGNLIALRELALRRTAERVQDDAQAYRIEKSIDTLWKTDAALLACIGPGAEGVQIVRHAARLAGQLGIAWHAVYVETPRLQRLPAVRRDAILKNLKLAEELDATTAVLAGSDVAQALVDYARGHNLSRLVVGRGHRQWWRGNGSPERIAQRATDIDLILVATSSAQEKKVPLGGAHNAMWRPRWWRYGAALAASLLTTLLATPLLPYFDLTNIVMLFLLSVVLVAVWLGRGAAVIATLASVAAFDFFFVPPRFSFAVTDVQYLVTFGVMLAVGLLTAHLTAGLRYQARVATRREMRARTLYEFARELSGVLQAEQVLESTRRVVQSSFDVQAMLLLPDRNEQLQMPPTNEEAIDIAIAQWAFDRATPAGRGTDTLPGAPLFYLPLVAPMRTRGVLAILPRQQESRRWMLVPEERQQLETFATLTAIALERVHYIDVAQEVLVKMESERLRNSLLAALSHDVRTPLTALVGLAESLTLSHPPLPAVQQDIVQALHEEALRMSRLVTNLLEMARIQSGEVKLNLQWQPVEEVVGTALHASRAMLYAHVVETRLPRDLPLVRFDAVLIERVLCNLLENAAKYTPPGSRIVIAAEATHGMLHVSVQDNGPGLPAGREEAVFEKFVRGDSESAMSGVGLGLAICRAIVSAHGGTIQAQTASGGGAVFVFELPLGTPPALPDLHLEEIMPEEKR